jgi:predicted dehydrogenase
MLNVLVVGYGSIGSRHARILTDMGCNVSVVSKRIVDFPKVYYSLENAIKDQIFAYIVIANKTNEHYDTMLTLVENDFRGVVLLEKPLFESIHEVPKHKFKGCYVAYNLRFHPLIQKIKEIVANENLLSIQVYVGQYLPSWRPNSDYRNSYSAKRREGGGVLRDLSHELDYILWLFGKWERVVSLGGKYSNLDIDSEDVFAFLLTTSRCPVVNVQMNYLDMIVKREIIINTDNHSIKVDLVNGLFQIDGTVEKIETNRDMTYILQHKAILSKNEDNRCSLEKGNEVLIFLEAIEKSAQMKRWISNE